MTSAQLLQYLLQHATKNDTTHLMNRRASLFHKPLAFSTLQVQALFTAKVPFLIQFMQQPQYSNQPTNVPARSEDLTALFLGIQVY
jgi:hypothetical protein